MREYLRSIEDEILESISQLIAIKTVFDETTIDANAPFGRGIRKGFDFILDLAKENNLTVKDVDGYAIHIEIGEGDELIALLCHMDTVDIFNNPSWSTDPFIMTRYEDHIYGRGVNDNKGPLVSCLYLLIALSRSKAKLNKRVRLIIGGAEETTWAGIKYYFEHEEMPDYGLSPDGNFPIVNCEKGVRYYSLSGIENHDEIISVVSSMDITRNCSSLTLKTYDDEIVYTGKTTSSRHPEKGINSFVTLSKDYDLDVFRQATALYNTLNMDKKFSCNISSFNYDCGHWILELDIRWEHDILELEVDHIVEQTIACDKVIRTESKNRLYIPSEDDFILSLQEVYKKVMKQDALLLTKGGASYARALKKGVAFGPCFPGETSNQHQANEKQSITGLLKSLEIYYEFLKKSEAIIENKSNEHHQTAIRT